VQDFRIRESISALGWQRYGSLDLESLVWVHSHLDCKGEQKFALLIGGG